MTTQARVQVRTTSRLHFGLLGWGQDSARQFGGVGLMIEEPGLELAGEPADRPEAEGALAVRSRELLANLPGRASRLGLRVSEGSARIRILDAPGEHLGLGVGTQLSLAVALAYLDLNAREPGPWDPTLLARLSGRGLRSGIGLHGFFRGGFLVDGGRRSEEDVPPLLAHHPFPEEWHILIVRPPLVGMHGPDEQRAFAELPPVPERITERLCRLVLLDLLPGLLERDINAFGGALSEMQRKVGECFSPVQGGLYASSLSEEIVEELDRLSLKGAGQSSWGPTLYAFSEADQTTRAEIAGRIRERFALPPDSVTWTRGANHGAIIERISPGGQ